MHSFQKRCQKNPRKYSTSPSNLLYLPNLSSYQPETFKYQFPTLIYPQIQPDSEFLKLAPPCCSPAEMERKSLSISFESSKFKEFSDVQRAFKKFCWCLSVILCRTERLNHKLKLQFKRLWRVAQNSRRSCLRFSLKMIVHLIELRIENRMFW